MGGLPLLRPRRHLGNRARQDRAAGDSPWADPFSSRHPLRPSEAVLVILLNPNVGRFVNEDGEVVVSHGPGRRQ
jgi:hypothetical protein